MDYPCAKFSDFSFSVLVFSCGQTDRQTHRQTHRITDAAKRFTPATIFGLSSNSSLLIKQIQFTLQLLRCLKLLTHQTLKCILLYRRINRGHCEMRVISWPSFPSYVQDYNSVYNVNQKWQYLIIILKNLDDFLHFCKQEEIFYTQA